MRHHLTLLLSIAVLLVAGCTTHNGALPRKHPSAEMDEAFNKYVAAVEASKADTNVRMQQDIHSIMVVQHGKVVEEKWWGDNGPDKPHVLFSVSKTFTATAVGLAIAERKLSLDAKLVDFFPDDLPDTVSEYLKQVTVKDLLTMTCGQDVDPTETVRTDSSDASWTKVFLAQPFVHEPGTFFCYNSVGTYMLSAIVQKVTGQKVVDYLTPRLFEPLGIAKPQWDESPQGIDCGGWGLYLKTEDMAKMGQLFLKKGRWNLKRVLPADWIKQASSYQVASLPAGVRQEDLIPRGIVPKNSDWLQGYGFQMWRCRHNAFRADGKNGQYILVIPEKDAVIAVTADVHDMQNELNYIWEYIYFAL